MTGDIDVTPQPKDIRFAAKVIKDLAYRGNFEQCVQELARREELTRSTAQTYISTLHNELPRLLSPVSESEKGIHLNRIAVLLDILGVAEDQEIVLIIKSFNRDFIYPVEKKEAIENQFSDG